MSLNSFVIAGCWWFLAARPITVQTATATAPTVGGTTGAVLQATGYITARQQATVSTQMTGTLVEVLIEEGDRVKSGQVIARLEDSALRAIGFPGLPVVVAVMLETMLLALVGGVIGGLAAWSIFNGYAASTLAAGTVGQLSFELSVTSALLWTGLKWALAIGFVGGLFPAVRAARLPVTTALREL